MVLIALSVALCATSSLPSPPLKQPSTPKQPFARQTDCARSSARGQSPPKCVTPVNRKHTRTSALTTCGELSLHGPCAGAVVGAMMSLIVRGLKNMVKHVTVESVDKLPDTPKVCIAAGPRRSQAAEAYVEDARNAMILGFPTPWATEGFGRQNCGKPTASGAEQAVGGRPTVVDGQPTAVGS